MFGFLNVFVAALLLRDGVAPAEAERLLVEAARDAFAFDDDALRWRDHVVSTARVCEGRERLVASFGSCSFEEPLEELRALGWLG